MIKKLFRLVPWRVVIPATIGGLLYTGWLEGFLFIVQKLAMETDVQILSHVRPRALVMNAILEGKVKAALFFLLVFGTPFFAGTLCGVAFSRNLRINRNTFTTPLYVGIILGFLFSVGKRTLKGAGQK